MTLHHDSIVQVVYSFGMGGSEVLGADLALVMKKHGWQSALCALEYGGPLEEMLEEEGIAHLALNRSRRPKLTSFLEMYTFLRRCRPRIVHTHHLYELVYALIPAKLAGATIVHTEHEYYSLLGKKTPLLRRLSRFCSAVTTVGDEITAYLADKAGISAAKLHTIPNGIDLMRFSGAGALSREALGFSPTTRLIGIVARLEPEKNHAMLLRGFAEVRRQRPETALLIVGDGSLRASLEHLCAALQITDSVRFVGTRRDIPDLLAMMDLFVLPSRNEGMPISILEAMSCGKPIIATDVGSVASVVLNGENGFIVAQDDSSMLARHIIHLLKNDSMRLAYGQRSRKMIEDSYDKHYTMTKYLKLYSQCLGR